MKKVLVWGAVVVGALSLTGCEKPYPGASVWSGTQSEFARALCWSFDAAQPIDEQQCAASVAQGAAGGGQLPELSILGGQTIGISVDPVVAENGWVPAIGGQPLIDQPITSTYWRFTFPEFQDTQGFELQIRAFGENPEQLRGLWAYTLVPRGSAG